MLFQHFLLMDDSLVVEGWLLLVAIWLGLLLLHLLLHVDKHLEDLSSNNIVGRKMAVAPWGEEGSVSSVASYWLTTGGVAILLKALLVLPFDGMPLWVIVCFLEAIGTRERLFVEDFGLDGKELLSMNSYLNESTNLWWIKIGLPWIRPTTCDLRRS